MTTWFNETLYKGFRQSHEVKKVLFEGRSKYQNVGVFESGRFGRILALDGVVQCTEGDEFVYHEMLTHLPILAHGKVESVLIIGGGDGGILEEVLKHTSVKRATMVEIDGEVIEVAKKYLPKICGKAFSDKRTNLIVGDGAAYVAETKNRYDLVIVDRPDPVGPATVLFSEGFYRNCRRVMKPNAILVAQNGVPHMQGPELTEAIKLFQKIWAESGSYLAVVPTYVCGFMSMTWACDRDITDVDPRQVFARFDKAKLPALRYYNPEIHFAAFALPNFVAGLIPAPKAAPKKTAKKTSRKPVAKKSPVKKKAAKAPAKLKKAAAPKRKAAKKR
ncbi:polyamine aminopropyltransferase [Ferrovibrio terrae]|uniref:Polyamine aminopropyltransferase n=1 Tax=Ferrovibrio terrae TaxID=2594003 RepID=A0A516H0I2_9PROT|nr:polyamine aminopropyltransferase [Ferrovibrio terrae]QDO97288.1 polyamine aminopropyltransferase [Ferrovibrio terrae]